MTKDIVDVVIPIIEEYTKEGNLIMEDIILVIDHINGETILEDSYELVNQINGL